MARYRSLPLILRDSQTARSRVWNLWKQMTTDWGFSPWPGLAVRARSNSGGEVRTWSPNTSTSSPAMNSVEQVPSTDSGRPMLLLLLRPFTSKILACSLVLAWASTEQLVYRGIRLSLTALALDSSESTRLSWSSTLDWIASALTRGLRTQIQSQSKGLLDVLLAWRLWHPCPCGQLLHCLW